MTMTYSGALEMPSSYAVMDEEEMMYLEGGDNVYHMTLSNAKTYFTSVMTMALACAAGSVAVPLPAMKLIGTNYYVYLAGAAMTCCNQCKEWLRQYSSSKSVRATEYTALGIITGYSVSL